MDKFLFTTMNGANQAMASQIMRMHNLANIDTVGFKANLESLQSQEVTGGVFTTRVHVTGKRDGADLSAGPTINTGRELDVAVTSDQGWFTVVDEEGVEAYTRAGAFQIDVNRQLVTADGRRVSGDGGPISIPEADKVTIGADGSISIQPSGQGPETSSVIGRLKLVNPPVDALRKGEDGYFYRKDGVSISEVDVNVQVSSQVLEGSNVNPVSTLVEILSFSRQYEMLIKMIDTAQQISTQASQMMSVR